MTPTNRYSMGFVFSSDKQNVVLIKKAKPKWQEGLLGAIGGKIEHEESPRTCMVREFKEEAGVETFISDWSEFAVLRGYKFIGFYAEVHCFVNISDEAYSTAHTIGDEEIQCWNMMRVLCRSQLLIPDLSVLLSLSICKEFERPIRLNFVTPTQKVE